MTYPLSIGIFRKVGAFLVLLALALGSSSLSAQGTYQFSTIRVPGSAGLFATEAMAINNTGQVTGDSQAGIRCFRYSAGTFQTFTAPFPDAIGTSAQGINDAGDIVGYFTVGSTVGSEGYLRSNGTFTRISVPSATWTAARGINNRGQIVGSYTSNTVFQHGFLLTAGTFKAIDPPFTGPASAAATETQARGINDSGHIVGYAAWLHAGRQDTGYLYVNGTFTLIDVPGATQTFAEGLNNADQIVGYYKNATGEPHGFVYAHGRFTTIDVPGAQETVAHGIDNAGRIVGYFTSGGERQGFIATPSR